MNPRFFRIRTSRSRPQALEREVREEIETHVAMWTDHLVARGIPREDAERAARQRFGVFEDAVGDVYRSAQHREARLHRRELWSALRQDIALAIRQSIRQPAFTLLALLTFALGIGANTAVFSVVRHVLLRPLPFKDPGALAAIWPTWTISNAELAYMQHNTQSFEEVAAFSPGWGIAMTGGGEPRQLDAARVSANFFQTLGVRPMLGRPFLPGENDVGRWDVAIISQALWRDQFGSDPAILDRVVNMDGNATRIIGVMPGGFELFQAGVDAWLPLQMDPASPSYPGQVALGFGRLALGATFAGATRELALLAPRIRDAYGYAEDYAKNVSVVGLQQSIVGETRQTLFVLLGAVGLLVLIAVANVGSLLLVHASSRTRELAIRRAIGASRAHLARQLLVQSLLLAIVGGVLGLGLGAVALRGLKTILPATLPMLSTTTIDGGVLLFCAIVTIAAGLAFGVAPALLATRVDPEGTLRAAGPARGGRASAAMRETLVIVEVALAMMLVVGAGLMTESVWRLSNVSLGYDPANVLTFRLQPTSGQLKTRDAVRTYWDAMTQRLAAMPGVEAVGAAQHLPLSGFEWGGDLDIERQPIPPTATHPRVTWRSVVGDYFGTMRIPLLRGRLFTAADVRDSLSVVVVNSTMAKRFWPNRDPIGERIHVGSKTSKDWPTIVGIVGDVRFHAPDVPATPEVYRPNAQQGLGFMHYVVRVRGNPLAHVIDVQHAVRSLDKTVPIAEVRSLEDLSSASRATRRTVAELLAAFAALGLILAAVGIYGVISYGVSQRTQELGVRTALGAQPGRIVGMVVREGARMAAMGIAIGALIAVVAARSLETLVFGVTTRDPAIYVTVAGTLVLVAVIASLVPARRAAHIDPLIALRGG
ncbi:MAG TPA: ABC transporter permease [Gemmatimonadaceae bacterium]